ncbi:MAG: TRAP-type mannitol/chloroaromatic compound transport system substrate-binding protein, partial [Bermanella sp.]
MSANQSSRKNLIILTLVAALVSLFWLYVSESAEEFSSDTLSASGNQRVYHWKMVTSWPKNYPGLGTAPEHFSEAVREMSDGRLNIKVYGAGELVPAMGVFDAVSLGNAEMGHSAAYYWKGKLAAAPFFTTVPFGMTAQEMNGWLHYGGGMELWR